MDAKWNSQINQHKRYNVLKNGPNKYYESCVYMTPLKQTLIPIKLIITNHFYYIKIIFSKLGPLLKKH